MFDFHLKNKLLALLGNLWSKNYAQPANLTTAECNLDLFEQERIDLQEMLACVNRHKIPLWHNELWVPLHIQEGRTAELPANLVALPLLTNRITSPSLVWHAGIDYELQRSNEKTEIVFKLSPFDEALLPSIGEIGAREVFLWGYAGKFDFQYLFEHLGIILDLKLPTSQQYKDTLNIICDILSFGTSLGRLEALLNVVLGVPVAQTDGEAVEGLYFDRRGPFVATSQNIYRLPENATDAIVRGRRLVRGEPVYKLAKIAIDTDIESSGPRIIVKTSKELQNLLVSSTNWPVLRRLLPIEATLVFD